MYLLATNSAYYERYKLVYCNCWMDSLIQCNTRLLDTVNDLINAHSQINAPYLIDAPLEVYSLY